MENLDDDEIGGGASLRFERERDIAVVEAWGEIDLAVVPQFKSVLDTALEADIAIIVDFGRVTYVDSSGFGALLETSRSARPLNVTLYLAACNSNILRMLEVTRLSTLFNVAPDVESAREAVRRLPVPAAV